MANRPGCIIGLDIGTSSAKAVAFDLRGQVLSEGSVPYPTAAPRPGWSEQSPERVCKAAVRALGLAAAPLKTPLLGIAISGAMHSLIALDKKGRPLTPSLLWSDNRSAQVAAQLKGSPLGRNIYRHTGTPIHPMSPLPKIAWLREHQPDIFKAAAHFIGIKEYIVHRLLGRLWTDYSMASATGLFDANRLDWHPPSLEFVGIEPSRLAKPVSPFTSLPLPKGKISEATGIRGGTPIVIGASDGCLANLGAGALSSADAVLSIGTSGAFRLTSTAPVFDEQERIFNYLLFEKNEPAANATFRQQRFVTGGASNNGAVVYTWFLRQFYGMAPSAKGMAKHWKALDEVPPGADGLLFLPYLHGERAPLWNAGAKACFVGASPKHTRAHFHRAVLEGILLNMALIGEVVAEKTGGFSRILANGGFTKLAPWVQMAADIFGKEVHVFPNEGGPALGAAALGAAALGIDAEFDMLAADHRPPRVFQPVGARAEAYAKALSTFLEKAFSSAVV